MEKSSTPLDIENLGTDEMAHMAIRLDLIDGATRSGDQVYIHMGASELCFSEEHAGLYLRGLLRGHIRTFDVLSPNPEGLHGNGSAFLNGNSNKTILVAEDDEEDLIFLRRSFRRVGVPVRLEVVRDGVQALDYLYRRGSFAETAAPRPDLILLDLNLPRKTGWEVLEEIKSSPTLHAIPVIILTTSDADQDILRGYDLGTNAFFTKPNTQRELDRIVSAIKAFWLDGARLPGSELINR